MDFVGSQADNRSLKRSTPSHNQCKGTVLTILSVKVSDFKGELSAFD